MFLFLKYLTLTIFVALLIWAFWGLFRHSWLHRKILGGKWKKVTEHAGNKFGFPYTFWVKIK